MTAARFDDARRMYDIAESTPGLPFPKVSAFIAEFRYTDITHAEVAQESVESARSALSDALGVTFTPSWPNPIGSSAHFIWEAWLPSGMRVCIVAKAAHMHGVPGTREPELAGRAA